MEAMRDADAFLAQPAVGGEARCGEYAGGIPRLGIALACYLPKGHNGQHAPFEPLSPVAQLDAEVARLRGELADLRRHVDSLYQAAYPNEIAAGPAQPVEKGEG